MSETTPAQTPEATPAPDKHWLPDDYVSESESLLNAAIKLSDHNWSDDAMRLRVIVYLSNLALKFEGLTDARDDRYAERVAAKEQSEREAILATARRAAEEEQRRYDEKMRADEMERAERREQHAEELRREDAIRAEERRREEARALREEIAESRRREDAMRAEDRRHEEAREAEKRTNSAVETVMRFIVDHVNSQPPVVGGLLQVGENWIPAPYGVKRSESGEWVPLAAPIPAA